MNPTLEMGNPMPLRQNVGKSFQGSIVLGKGFVLSIEEAERLISKDPRNKEVLFPYLNGDDLNNSQEQKPSRWVINFFDWSEEKARTYPDCYEIVERLVKPDRQRWKTDNKGKELIGVYALRKPLPHKWWIYGEKRPSLYNAISELHQVMAINRYTKYLTLDFQPNSVVFSDSIVIFSLNSFYHYSIYSSSIHEIWAWKNSSTMGSSTLRYSPTNSFETFPLPASTGSLIEEIGTELYYLRKSIMAKAQIGFTQLYNIFHSNDLNKNNEIKEDILRLRKLHSVLDEEVIKVYNWDDILLEYDFYEIEFLPENDRTRFTFSPSSRKEIIKRLLILNHKQFNEELELKKNKDRNNLSINEGLFSV
jgi:hypothetical protein